MSELRADDAEGALGPQEAIQLDGEILYALLRRVCPLAYRHLEKHKMDPILYMTEWFMCAFSRTLPWASVLRVWDMFFCEGEGLLPDEPPNQIKLYLYSAFRAKLQCKVLNDTMQIKPNKYMEWIKRVLS